MAITAKFDLETQQMDTVNAFVQTPLWPRWDSIYEMPAWFRETQQDYTTSKSAIWSQAVAASMAEGIDKVSYVTITNHDYQLVAMLGNQDDDA